jgi:hypothetical protein
VGLRGHAVGKNCFQEIAGFSSSLLLRIESLCSGKMARSGMYALSAGALCDAGLALLTSGIFQTLYIKRI